MRKSELLFILSLVKLYFQRFVLKIKIIHDEFLYDRVLNSYHSHIYMLSRIGKLLDTLNCLLCIECCQALWTLWYLSLLFQECVHSTPSKPFQPFQPLHKLCYFYPGSTQTLTLFYSIYIHPKIFYSYSRSKHQKYFPTLIHLAKNSTILLKLQCCYNLFN